MNAPDQNVEIPDVEISNVDWTYKCTNEFDCYASNSTHLTTLDSVPGTNQY